MSYVIKSLSMIPCGFIVQAPVQAVGTYCTENEKNIDLFNRLIVMNGQGASRKSYTIDIVLTTLANEQGLDEYW